MHSATKDLDGFGQVGCLWQRDQGFFPVAYFLHVFQRYWLPLPALLGELVEGSDIFLVGVRQSDHEQQVGVEVAVVERTRGVFGVFAVA